MKKIFILIIVISISVLECPNVISSILPDHVTLTWSSDPHTTQTITWRTDVTVISGSVQYANVEDSANIATKGIYVKEDSSAKFKTDVGTWKIHTITIKSLKPGKTYCYRVGYGNSWSAKSTFTTEASETKSFRFLVFGDSQTGVARDTSYKVFGTTIHNAYKANPTSKFFVNMGDLVEIGGYYRHWNNWFEAVKDIVNKIPTMPVLGNHDTFKDSLYSGGSEKPKYFIRQFKTPQQNVPNDFKGQIYSYDYGDVHFAVWDSQIQEEKFSEAIIKEELDWLSNDLKSTSKKWKVVLFHKPPYYNSPTRSNDKLKAMLQPIFDQYHVDLVLNGHDHGVSWTYPIKADTFVSKPSQGTIYYITGRSGNKGYSELVSKVWNAFFYNPVEKPNYIVAEVNGDQFKIMAFRQDGTPLDTCIIDKSKDEIFDGSVKIKLPEKYAQPTLVLFGAISKTDKPEIFNNNWYFQTDVIKKYFGYTFKDYKSMNMLMFSKDGKH
jgi:Icc-related predicted phosphoesterase